jgi:magnesium transporter
MGKRIIYADDDTESIWTLIKLRVPSIFAGLLLGIILSFATSKFEQVLEKNIQISFFLPFIVYMADAVGTQTQSIYSRDLRSGKPSFWTYMVKETIVGVTIGAGCGLTAAAFSYIWLRNGVVALAVGLAMFGSIFVAAPVALIVTELLQLEHKDPAVGAGPIATVIQDTISVLVYGFIATALVLRAV